jgi:hypothetical protein
MPCDVPGTCNANILKSYHLAACLAKLRLTWHEAIGLYRIVSKNSSKNSSVLKILRSIQEGQFGGRRSVIGLDGFGTRE